MNLGILNKRKNASLLSVVSCLFLFYSLVIISCSMSCRSEETKQKRRKVIGKNIQQYYFCHWAQAKLQTMQKENGGPTMIFSTIQRFPFPIKVSWQKQKLSRWKKEESPISKDSWKGFVFLPCCKKATFLKDFNNIFALK